METIRELDQDDPDVLGHREEHLADVLGLLLFMAVGAELRELRDPVDELGDLRTEAFLDVGQAVLGVLGHVMEQGRLDGDGIDPELGQDLGRGDRVGRVWLTGRATLAGVRLDGEIERTVDRVRVGVGVVLGEGRQERGPERFEVRFAGRPASWRRGCGASRGASRRPGRRCGRLAGRFRAWRGRGHGRQG